MYRNVWGIISRYGKWLTLFILLYFPIFLNLDVLPIRMWDESQNAMNAYEMLHNGHWLVPTYQGQPDMFSLKPSLSAFLEMLLMSLLGPGELSVRLLSAMAALFTSFFILLVSIRLFKNFWLGFIACLVLITTSGYITEHVSRTGDSDSTLIFFMTVYGLSFFAASEVKNEQRKNYWLHLFFLALILASLTKGVAAFLILPGLLIYSLVTKNFLWWFKKPAAYIYALLLVALNVFYYWWREIHSPGYWQRVMDLDLFGRFSQPIDGRTGGFWYYLDLFNSAQMTPWIYLLPLAFIAGLFLHKGIQLRLLLFCSLVMIFHYIVIGTSVSKALWYAAPEYPFIALILALFISYFHTLLIKFAEEKDSMAIKVMPFLLLVMVFQFPYRLIVQKVYDKHETFWDASQFDISYYLRAALHEKKNLNGYKYLPTDYTRHMEFYIDLLKDKGDTINSSDIGLLQSGDKVITYARKSADALNDRYETVVVEEFKEVVKVFRIIQRKPEIKRISA
jgi:4-amino-4-deoxy-L-arabinose transferase-like glycosyltransferase